MIAPTPDTEPKSKTVAKTMALLGFTAEEVNTLDEFRVYYSDPAVPSVTNLAELVLLAALSDPRTVKQIIDSARRYQHEEGIAGLDYLQAKIRRRAPGNAAPCPGVLEH